jgi:hypothetical protein
MMSFMLADQPKKISDLGKYSPASPEDLTEDLVTIKSQE